MADRAIPQLADAQAARRRARNLIEIALGNRSPAATSSRQGPLLAGSRRLERRSRRGVGL